mmetsp:Transcript_35563/g.55488  ORF Transcript_35563/g.55488 Transcript_35563/m.55488 type:complete len:130 (-) Transcript_35563:94-483(-)
MVHFGFSRAYFPSWSHNLLHSHSSGKEEKEKLTMDDSIQKHIGEALDLVESLRTILPSSSPLELPSVIVVGCQSAGKSSLIERLSGVALPQVDFLIFSCFPSFFHFFLSLGRKVVYPSGSCASDEKKQK